MAPLKETQCKNWAGSQQELKFAPLGENQSQGKDKKARNPSVFDRNFVEILGSKQQLSPKKITHRSHVGNASENAARFARTWFPKRRRCKTRWRTITRRLRRKAKQNRSIQREDRQRSYNLRQDEMKEPKVNSEQWKRLVGEKRSRGKLAAGLHSTHWASSTRSWRCTRARRCVRIICSKKPRRH